MLCHIESLASYQNVKGFQKINMISVLCSIVFVLAILQGTGFVCPLSFYYKTLENLAISYVCIFLSDYSLVVYLNVILSAVISH